MPLIKYRYIFTTVILFLLGIIIWRTSILFTNLSSLFSNMETAAELSAKADKRESTKNLSKSPKLIDNNVGHYETIEETIARLKHDVIVTGTILGVPGQESALFQIKGMPDSSFKINTQLMDGFIIKEITNSYVVLKNQVGNETFSLYVQNAKGSLDNDGNPGIVDYSEQPENTGQDIPLDDPERERILNRMADSDRYEP